ncbi:hypothetical protein DAEQUDRAFT_766353 [Daedalea quercina L-15889]|uniref:Protein kinase domain-containing protein n=1 Tax=Daedalea quercina L-15889 TaxID=1314783 RepID=A0A165PLH9_9APHY|nr:hypothetical protein DAEQUDRAFT_766353 [Daedalea quercina L-15889]
MAETREFDFPILLAAPPVGKHRYLAYGSYECLASERAYVSNMIDSVLSIVRDVTELDDTTAEVQVFELKKLSRPVLDSDDEYMEFYKDVDDAFLRNNGIRWSAHRSLTNVVPPGNFVAVLITSAVRPPTRSITTLLEVSELGREDIAAAARKRDSSSSGATAACRTATQVKRKDAVYNYRPLDLAPPPITIYHTVFAKFLRMMNEPCAFTHEELDHAQKFVTQAVTYYSKEDKRIIHSSEMALAVHPQILSSMSPSFTSSRLEPDGVVRSAMLHNDLYTVPALAEVKVEVGEGGCEPLAQAECAYVAIYSSDEARPVRQACCCPALLVGMAGPNIVVSGAVFADQLIAQPLTDYISVIPRPGQEGRSPLDDTGHRVARLFKALKVCIAELDGYYAETAQRIASPPPPAVAAVMGSTASVSRASAGVAHMHAPPIICPHFSEYLDNDGQLFKLVYEKWLVPHITMKAVFIAEARSTNTEAQGGAETAKAPRLRHCAYEDSVGMWVIVMDYVEGGEVKERLTEPAHVASLRAAVGKLHDCGLVFGDLRRPNVLVAGERVVLIDFDWRGKAGEARYPSDLNLDGTIPWHDGVKRGGLIEQLHDKHLFTVLTGKEM